MKWSRLWRVICAVLWSSGGLFIKLIDWSPLAIAGGRAIIAAIVVGLFLPKGRRQWNRWTFAGAVAYSAVVITFVTATKWTTAANAIFLQFTAPIYVALLGGWFLGEQTSRGDWIRIAIAQGGILLFFVGDLNWGGIAGNLVALGSGLAFAVLVVLLRKQKDANPADSVLLGNLLTAAVCLPALIGPLPEMKSLLALVYLGAFQLGLSYVLFTRAIRHTPALTAMLISMIEPILNPIWVLLVLGEAPGWAALAGGIIVVGCATAQAWITNTKTAPSSQPINENVPA